MERFINNVDHDVQHVGCGSIRSQGGTLRNMSPHQPTQRHAAPNTGDGAPLSLTALLDIKDHVVPLARDLGRWARDRSDAHQRGELDLGTHAKTTPGDVVTEVDVEVQRRILDSLGTSYPTFGFLGEEDVGQGSGADASGLTWVIDPIDGTHNFVRGYPSFCVSIGLVDDTESVLGAIYDAQADAVFWAVKGGGAWREDVRLHVAPDKALDHALLTTGFTSGSAATAWQQQVFIDLARGSAGMRQSGSSCRDLCFVSAGKVDLFWQFGIHAWDVAAGIVLVTEAGGAVAIGTGPDGLRSAHATGRSWVSPEPLTIVAGTKRLVDDVVAVIQRH